MTDADAASDSHCPMDNKPQTSGTADFVLSMEANSARLLALNVQQCLGHSDIESTMRYLVAI